jgi:hypothetical protein
MQVTWMVFWSVPCNSLLSVLYPKHSSSYGTSVDSTEESRCTWAWICQIYSAGMHLAYMSIRLWATRTFKLITTLTHLLVRAYLHECSYNSAHALSTPAKLAESACAPSCCNCCESFNGAFCPCPNLTCPKSRAFQETTFHVGVLLNTLHASSMPHIWCIYQWDYDP